MNRLSKYFEFIGESMDNPYEIVWKDNGKILLGLFYSSSNEYLIECLEQFNNNWSFVFYIKNDDQYITQSIRNEDNFFRVLATIKKSIEHLFLTKDTNSIIFTSLDKNKVRSKLYDNFSKKFSEENNINYKHYNSLKFSKEIDIDIYILYKNLTKTETDNLIKSVKKIIENDKI
jgi:hypothetical protein